MAICKIFKRSKMGCANPTEDIFGYIQCESTEDVYKYFAENGISFVEYGYDLLSVEQARAEAKDLRDRLVSLAPVLEAVSVQ